MKIYHGSNEKNFKFKKGAGPFEGVFGSSRREVALSHGDYVFVADVPEHAIASNSDLEKLAPHPDVLIKLLFHNHDRIFKSISVLSEDAKDVLHDSVVFEDYRNLHPVEKELKEKLPMETEDLSWEMQRLRGNLAAMSGFKAVEMCDEHGTSYLVKDANFQEEITGHVSFIKNIKQKYTILDLQEKM